ncbi:Ppx/GppA phosphatase family protein [Rhodomicrobium lacus]|uniref:Ppx/GppA phosphatase family protein n=1 Tax=Rhodomicrobium lacus TaxID=2498452 RepID=UPI0026E3760F|nr:Ppx/GppA phosphatase family protein [Rhodomicrobium lacus]WKW51137.1 Ppx/GppA phosphatase family protein [Rhodomicrobium lacus]
MDNSTLGSISGRLPGARPVAVIDIGSNSIRLVVYERLTRAPTPLFQEKAMCGLGRYLNELKRLNPETVPSALASLARFRKLADICGVRERDIHPFATAAVRWAEDGPEFLAKAEEACGVPIRVIGNAEEAELAATGVRAGFVNPRGIVGDLGGGSMELVRIDGETLSDKISLPLGSLSLAERTRGEKTEAIPIIEDALASVEWLNHVRGENFYAIGGTWRALAKLHMAQTNYPLSAVHGYKMDARKALQITARYANNSPTGLKRLAGMSAGREETVPFGALLLNSLIRKMQPSDVIFSAFGVREGTIYRLLSEAERAEDPLLSACETVAAMRARSLQHGRELIEWTDGLFARSNEHEHDDERRLRHAACLLSDISWRAHPDYRGEQSAVLISQSAFAGIDHPGRAFLALCVYHRYERKLQGELMPKLAHLLPRPLQKRALIIGQTVRLAHTLTAGMKGLLPQTTLLCEQGKLVLSLPTKLESLDGEQLRRRLRSVAREMALQPEVVVSKHVKQTFFGGLFGG